MNFAWPPFTLIWWPGDAGSMSFSTIVPFGATTVTIASSADARFHESRNTAKKLTVDFPSAGAEAFEGSRTIRTGSPGAVTSISLATPSSPGTIDSRTIVLGPGESRTPMYS